VWDCTKTILASSGKKTKHIKAKFFFVKDRVDDGEIKVIDCPTEEMWADIMTKPLQGMAFRTMRAELMNCPVNYEERGEDVEEDNFPISAAKTVTWKSDVATTFKTPQECFGQNGNRKGNPGMAGDGQTAPELQPLAWKHSWNIGNRQTCKCQKTGRSITREAT